jgi:hypothetical protein
MSSGFERLVDYTNGFDPGFADGIEGASEAEIDELNALLNDRMPPTYREFLRLMGRSTDWIAVPNYDLRIHGVLSYYRRETWMAETDYIRIGAAMQEPSFNPHLRLRADGEEPDVVCFPGCGFDTFLDVVANLLDPVSGSLLELVAMPVFRTFELCPDGRKATYLATESRADGDMDRAEEAALGLGFEKRWFSSPTGRALARADGAAIRLNGFEDYPLMVWLASDDPMGEAALIGALRDVLPGLTMAG